MTVVGKTLFTVFWFWGRPFGVRPGGLTEAFQESPKELLLFWTPYCLGGGGLYTKPSAALHLKPVLASSQFRQARQYFKSQWRSTKTMSAQKQSLARHAATQ